MTSSPLHLGPVVILLGGLSLLVACGEGSGEGGADPGSSAGNGASTGGASPGTGGESPGSGGQASGGQAMASGGQAMGSGGQAMGSGGQAMGSGGQAMGSGGGGDCVPTVPCDIAPPAATGDLVQDCVNRVNQLRVECGCLGPLERWTEGESCAAAQAHYDLENDAAHKGFGEGICEPGGWAQNECPGYGSESSVIEGCLRSMWNEGPPPQEPCEDSCYQQHGHYINMTNPDFSKVACGFAFGEDGEVWAVQNFSN